MSDFPVLSFTDQDVREAAARDQLRLGWFYFVNQDCTKKVTEAGKNPGSCMLTTKAAPCKEPGDPTSASRPVMYDNLILPFVNPDVAGHTKPNTAGMVLDKLNAMLGDDEVPAVRKNSDGEYVFKGKVVPAAKVTKAREESTRAAMTKAVELWNEPEGLKGCGYYAEVIESKPDEQGRVFRNLIHHCAELPEDAVLVPADQFIEKAISKDEPEEDAVFNKAASRGKKGR
jgi:hypothetical protein